MRSTMQKKCWNWRRTSAQTPSRCGGTGSVRRGRELKGAHIHRLEMMLWDGGTLVRTAQSNNCCDKRTASWDGDDRHVSASTHAHAHFAGVGMTYEVPTGAQRRNIVRKCQGESRRDKKYCQHTRGSVRRRHMALIYHIPRPDKLFFPPLNPTTGTGGTGQRRNVTSKERGWGGDAEWDEIMWRLISFILVHATGAQKAIQRQLFKNTKC